MIEKIPISVKSININTGNILNLREIKQLTGVNQSDEFIESLKLTVSNWTPNVEEDDKLAANIFMPGNVDVTDGSVELDSLKLSLKVFITSNKSAILEEAIRKVFTTLKVTRVDSLVLACKLEPSAVLSGLQSIWSEVEELVAQGAVTDVGVSDVDTDVFIALYQWAKIKPRIIQINLAVCCVVPPILQEFCKANNVQLLTHSDPMDFLPRPALYQVLAATEAENLSVDWIARYLMHIQSRGVLQSKGYLASISKGSS